MDHHCNSIAAPALTLKINKIKKTQYIQRKYLAGRWWIMLYWSKYNILYSSCTGVRRNGMYTLGLSTGIMCFHCLKNKDDTNRHDKVDWEKPMRLRLWKMQSRKWFELEFLRVTDIRSGVSIWISEAHSTPTGGLGLVTETRVDSISPESHT